MSEPLAYFLTWTCYGTWLHGDERGSVDDDHRTYGLSCCAPDATRLADERRRQRGPAFALNDQARRVVNETITAHCAYRRWTLLALNVRTNHVHVVVEYAGEKPETVLAQFKAWTTRRLREANLVAQQAAVWTHHGSTRYLWDRRAIQGAISYVTESQGDDLL